MNRIEFESGQYVVYAKNHQQALLIIAKELSRFDKIKYLVSELVTENGDAWKNLEENTVDERLNIYFYDDKSFIDIKDGNAKGKVSYQKIDETHVKIDEDGYYMYELTYSYPDLNGDNVDFRLAREMIRLMLNPSNETKQTYDKRTNTKQISGLIRSLKGKQDNPNAIYGEKIQESAINLLAQLANRGSYSADDIISGKVDISEFNSYKKCDNLVKLLVIAMNNNINKETNFEGLMKQKIDSVVKHADGTREPANTFFYGILNDSSIIEKEFDNYMGRGTWRKLNLTISKMYQPKIEQKTFDSMYSEVQGLIVKFAEARMKDRYKQDFKINELGEIIKPEIQGKKEKISMKHKIAQFFRKHDVFMEIGFVEKFVNKQLNILPTGELSAQTAKVRLKQDFENRISNNGKYKELANTRKISNPDKIANIHKKAKSEDKFYR